MHVPSNYSSMHACIYGIQATQSLVLSVSITARRKHEHCQPLNIISSSLLLLTLMSDLAPNVCLPLGKKLVFFLLKVRGDTVCQHAQCATLSGNGP